MTERVTYRPTVVHANFVVPSGFLAILIGREFGIPSVFHERSLQDVLLTRQHRFYPRGYRDMAATWYTINSRGRDRGV